jgi:hypothetical protein
MSLRAGITMIQRIPNHTLHATTGMPTRNRNTHAIRRRAVFEMSGGRACCR